MKSLNLQSLSLIDYPAGRESVILRRLETLENLEVELNDFVAKGYRGTVFSGFIKPSDPFTIPVKVAIKFARSDAGKEQFLLKEARILEYLEAKSVAPVIYYYDEDMIIMEYVDGFPFSFERFFSKEKLVNVIREILEKCFILDRAGVSHSELKGEKHIILTDRGVRFIDFESARFTDSPRNLLQFLGFHIIRKPERLAFLGIDRNIIKKAIGLYKENPISGFKEILGLFHI
ncbi:protein kinase domain-containing protein [Desulfurobacterium sp.]